MGEPEQNLMHARQHARQHAPDSLAVLLYSDGACGVRTGGQAGAIQLHGRDVHRAGAALGPVGQEQLLIRVRTTLSAV